MCQIENMNLQAPVKRIRLICPNCQADLTMIDAIHQVRTGVQKNTLSYNAKHNWFDSQEYEFDTDDIFEEYNCAKCGKEISETIKNFI